MKRFFLRSKASVDFATSMISMSAMRSMRFKKPAVVARTCNQPAQNILRDYFGALPKLGQSATRLRCRRASPIPAGGDPVFGLGEEPRWLYAPSAPPGVGKARK